MIRTKKAKARLSRVDWKHLNEAGIHSMYALKRQVKEMKASGHECVDCRIIAKKLDVWK